MGFTVPDREPAPSAMQLARGCLLLLFQLTSLISSSGLKLYLCPFSPLPGDLQPTMQTVGSSPFTRTSWKTSYQASQPAPEHT